MSSSLIKSRNHLMVMAGGTGGHVFPALAVANALIETGTKITWLGTRRGLEARVIPENNIDIQWISVEGLRGKGLLSWLMAPFNLLRAMWQSANVIRRLDPDCVLGMGGFVGGPGGLVARIMGKPLIVHEQNAVAGLTNKYLAKIANRVLTGFPNVVGLPSTARWVGNPVRKNIRVAVTEVASHADQAIKVLVIGGSQGAHSFNLHLAAVFAQQSALIEVWHQSGKDRKAQVEESYAQADLQVRVSEFIDDMAGAYAWADLLICRAGAMTIAECCAAGKPALLIPFPFSAGGHQDKNAQVLVDVGAAKVLDNAELGAPIMVQTLATLLSDKTELRSMGQAAQQLHKPDALASVVAACEEYLHA
ncbi:MAG: UDP-N-acetylglucosamine--N-acetylmuramyl-(pentapeptide) pyrophosphoryl-undecaprenol N-acetylglucosamine transferase [Arenicella sp.]|jgi:UDP-N-acetylglucosamine--N-acetylmuramyl-(pentapeptide) pyrophosphoryl-undecaprenol N-acetylglucosamine transferase